MNLLVTGGAGYIGSHTVYSLIEKGYGVVVADDLQTGHIEAVHNDAKFYCGNIQDTDFLDDLFKREKIDAVIHFAANSLVGESMTFPLKYYENNVYGTMMLVKSMIKNNVHNLVFSSTAAVYGEPENIPIKEDDKKLPTNTYGETKLAIENMLKRVSCAYDFKFAALRYFNAAGAHKNACIGEAHRPETHLIPIVLETAKGKRDFVTIFGDDYETKDGTCIRDYIHVSDLAQAHILAVEYLKNKNESNIFNLGNGIGFSVKEVIDSCRKVTGHQIQTYIEKRRPGDPAVLVASSSKAKSILGWQPEYTSLDTIIQTAWNWHKNQRYH